LEVVVEEVTTATLIGKIVEKVDQL